MNRKILFRGKRVDNGDWVEGNYLEVYTLRGCVPLIMGKNYDEEEKCITDHALVIPSTVGQYTGLTDKNGRKIFEGDVVRKTCLTPSINKVEYDDTQGAFITVHGDFYDLLRAYTTPNSNIVELLEVIGNIHDNPELLKGV